MSEAAPFQSVAFSALPGWNAVDHGPALAAFRRSAERLLAGRAETGALGLRAEAFRPAAAAALAFAPGTSARGFFETHFAPAFIDPGEGTGFVTGYYEPVVEASLRRTARFTVPLYRPPPDLVAVDPGVSPLSDPTLAFARRRFDGILEEYPDRAAIRRGALDGQGLEIAWLADPVEAFFIHVQGSARLQLEDGRTIRVGYAAKTGHRFTAVGRILVNEGELVLDKADMAGIRRWLADHPDRALDLLDRNRSFIFFRRMPATDEALGPVGAAGVPLTPFASLAVDRLLHTYGTPVFVDAPGLSLGGADPFRRLLVAQDTGSAIVGPARGDIFVGSGEAAGAAAGRVRHAAAMFALVPKAIS